MWCLPQIDAASLARMEDALELYERPYNPQAPVVCLDEKPVSLHGEVRPPEPARPSVVAKRDSEYKRQGTANVFCAVEPRAGRHFAVHTPRRTGAAFAKVMAMLAINSLGTSNFQLGDVGKVAENLDRGAYPRYAAAGLPQTYLRLFPQFASAWAESPPAALTSIPSS